MLRAGGTRGAFGSDGKAIQVGLAAGAGVQAALMAQAGAVVDPAAIHGPLGFEAVFGANWPQPETDYATPSVGAVRSSATGSSCTPAALARTRRSTARRWRASDGYRLDHDQLEVVVHPIARQAAHLDTVSDGLGAKFSIPYCVAHTLTHGPPRVRDFSEVDDATVERSRQIAVGIDDSLPEFGAVLNAGDAELARVLCPRGAPDRPIGASELADKVADLAGDRLDGVLDDPQAAAAVVLTAAGLSESRTAV